MFLTFFGFSDYNVSIAHIGCQHCPCIGEIWLWQGVPIVSSILETIIKLLDAARVSPLCHVSSRQKGRRLDAARVSSLSPVSRLSG
jgi:hypothetical protein